MRNDHTGYPGRPTAEVHDFEPPSRPQRIFSREGLTVEAVQVRHEPVPGAVGYRVTTPDGIVVISGDTAVCEEVANLAAGADVLVHEVFDLSALPAGTVSDARKIAAYHSDPGAVGSLAQRAGVATLMMTHLIPAPQTVDDYARFVQAARSGGFEGEIIVCDDLATVQF